MSISEVPMASSGFCRTVVHLRYKMGRNKICKTERTMIRDVKRNIMARNIRIV